MHSEDTKKIKCDRCGATVGLRRHTKGWRCTECIWQERENLIEWAKCVLGACDYTNPSHVTKTVVVVSRKSLDELAKVVREATL